MINEMAEMYNAERLKEYCNWFYRRNSYFLGDDEVDDEDDAMSLKG
jgi:hypothetical protein